MRLAARLTAISLLVSLAVAPAALGDDLKPAPYRGDELSVRAEWDNLGWTSGSGIMPIFRSPTSMGWFGGSKGQFNWNSPPFAFLQDQSMTVGLPNFIDEEPLKKIRFQFAGSGVTDNNGKLVEEWWTDQERYWDVSTSSDDSASDLDEWQIVATGGEIRDDGTFHAYTDFEIKPNPDWEMLVANDVPAGIMVDQIVVDTISVPEPGTFVLAGVGMLLMGLYVLRRRRQ